MKFALNYSPEAARLLTSNAIEFDYFKTPPWPEMIAEAVKYRPVAVHFNLKIGQRKIHQSDWGFIENLLKTTATRYVNVHIAPRYKDHPKPGAGHTGKATRQAAWEVCASELAEVVRRFGAEHVIAENVPYRGETEQKYLSASVQPEFIGGLIEETGCGLLLDIAHARISAINLGVETQDYIAALPLGKLHELHFTGVHKQPDDYLQDHLGMTAADWEWFETALAAIRNAEWAYPTLLAFEYGGTGDFFANHSEESVLLNDVPRFVEGVRSLDGSQSS